MSWGLWCLLCRVADVHGPQVPGQTIGTLTWWVGVLQAEGIEATAWNTVSQLTDSRKNKQRGWGWGSKDGAAKQRERGPLGAAIPSKEPVYGEVGWANGWQSLLSCPISPGVIRIKSHLRYVPCNPNFSYYLFCANRKSLMQGDILGALGERNLDCYKASQKQSGSCL